MGEDARHQPPAHFPTNKWPFGDEVRVATHALNLVQLEGSTFLWVLVETVPLACP